MRKNTAGQVVAFQAVSKTDGSDVTTGTPVVYYKIDNGSQGTGTGTVTHEGNGSWSYAPTQAETNGNHVSFTFTLSGAVSQLLNLYPVSFDPTDSVRIGLTALPDAAAGAAGGLPTDSTGKTSFNDLDAAGVRTAVGMASANLDTQLGDIPTVSEFEARTLAAAAYFDPSTDTVANVTTVGSVSGSVTVGTNNDKSGYSLTAGTGLGNQTANITGNLSGSVGSVTAGVTVTTNNDKTGYSLSSSGLNAVTAWTVDLTGTLTGNVTGSVGSVTSPVTAGTVTDKTGYSLSSSGLNAVTAWTVDLTGTLTGNVTGSVGSVTSPVTAGTVTDKTGYSLSSAGNTEVVDSLFARIPTKASQHTVERIFWNSDRVSIVNDGEVVANVANTAQSFETTLTGMADKYNDSLIQFTSGTLAGESNSIASMDAAGVITFHNAFTAVPSAADEFIVRPESSHSPEEIAAAIESLLSTTARAELASAPAANAPLADKLTWLAQLARNKMQSTALQQTLYADDETTVVATFAVSDDGTTATRGEAT